MIVLKKIPEDLDALEADLVIAVVGSDEQPLRSTNAWIDWRLYGSITELISRRLFRAELGEKCLLPTYGRFKFDRLVLLGAGEIFNVHGLPSDEEGQAKWRKVAQLLDHTVQALKVQKVGLSLPRYEGQEHEHALLEVLRLANLPVSTSLFLSRASSQLTPLSL